MTRATAIPSPEHLQKLVSGDEQTYQFILNDARLGQAPSQLAFVCGR